MSRNNNRSLPTASIKGRWLEKIGQGLAIALVSSLLMSASSQNDRLLRLESTTMDKIEIVDRVNDLERNIDSRLDAVEKNQGVMLLILKRLDKRD